MSLKKALSKDVNKIYLNTGVFFEHQRGVPACHVKKNKSFQQSLFLKASYVDKPADSEGGLSENTPAIVMAKSLKSRTKAEDLGFGFNNDSQEQNSQQKIL